MSAPPVTLRDMLPDEYDARTAKLDAHYVESLTALMPVEQAREKARNDRARFLPRGLATEGHRHLVAENAAGETVGHAWLGPDPETGAADPAWLYDIEVEAAHRRCGYGRAILAGVEELVRAAGATRLRFNVFGGNRPAIALYESAGYQVTDQRMAKSLG
jgi:ribosomal protein S18 acetylase RimI-like enzyme